MPTDTTFFDEAGAILAPYVVRELSREEVRRRAHEAEARRTSGVCYGGEVRSPFPGRSDAEIQTDAHKAYQRNMDFASSPRGRFLLALRELEQVGFSAEAEKVRNAYSRGMADERKTPALGAVSVAMKTLIEINHSDARAALVALAEILAAASQQKAA